MAQVDVYDLRDEALHWAAFLVLGYKVVREDDTGTPCLVHPDFPQEAYFKAGYVNSNDCRLVSSVCEYVRANGRMCRTFHLTTPSWSTAGNFVDLYGVSIKLQETGNWIATTKHGGTTTTVIGPTAVVAVLRCVTLCVLGGTVDLPEEITK